MQPRSCDGLRTTRSLSVVSLVEINESTLAMIQWQQTLISCTISSEKIQRAMRAPAQLFSKDGAQALEICGHGSVAAEQHLQWTRRLLQAQETGSELAESRLAIRCRQLGMDQ